VNWALDSLSLVSGKLAEEKVTIDDSSPEGTSRIHLVFDKAKLVTADPKSTVFFAGGGWGVINFFRSEEALNQWLVRYPELKDKPRGTIEQSLAEIKKRQKL